MFDNSLRGVKDRIGEPLAARLDRISPNAITLVAFVIGLLAALFAARGLYLWALGLWLLNRLLDGLDGLVARVQQKQSDFGGYLDILLDFGVYAALPIGLVLSAPTFERYEALAFMLAAFYVNSASWMYLAAVLEKRSTTSGRDVAAPRGLTTVVMPSGLIGAVETLIAYCLFLLWPGAIEVLYAVFGVLVLFTVAQRLVWARRTLH